MTGVFDRGTGHEQVTYFNDPASGLRAIIAIYSTALGPALGGTRLRDGDHVVGHPFGRDRDVGACDAGVLVREGRRKGRGASGVAG